jgi:pyruvate, orthophosphate dikinase
VQKHDPLAGLRPDHAQSAQIATASHGWRAKCLQRLVRLDLPVPKSVALPTATVRAIAAGHGVDAAGILDNFGDGPLISVRPSPANPDWGGPATILNIGLNAKRHARLAETHGEAAADALYLRFVQAYAIHVARLDPEVFDGLKPGPGALRRRCASMRSRPTSPSRRTPPGSCPKCCAAMARAWEGTSARLLRQAKGAPTRRRWGWSCRRWRRASGRGFPGRA